MGMTPRYRHWIQPATVGSWPTDIVCVDCASTVDPTASGMPGKHERLVSWHAVRMVTDCGSMVDQSNHVGQTGDGFLRMIADLCKSCNNLWVVSFKAQRTWALLDVWGGIEDGTIKLLDSDHRNSEASRQRLSDYRRRQKEPLRPLGGEEIARIHQVNSGYLVLEDPPNILRCRLYNSCHLATWVDVRNYGIDNVDGCEPGADTAEWIATFMSRICHLCRQHNLSALKATSGSQAMSAWRHNFLTEKVYVHCDTRAEQIESAAYCGGRCEASRIGVVSGPVYHVDFRSCYGWVCVEHRLPTALSTVCDGASATCRQAIGDHSSTVATVVLTTDEPAYPVKRDGLVIYPVGTFTTTLCGPELEDAFAHGRVIKVVEYARYRMGTPLQAYALELYKMRVAEENHGFPGAATWIKRMLVGLPGKLGQRNHRWVDCPDVMPQTLYGEWYGEGEGTDVIRYRSIGGIVQRDCIDGYAADSVPAIAAFVTSYGRIRLLGAIRTAGRENVHYVDTDSLFVNKEGMRRLLESEYMASKGLGSLTLRGVYNAMDIRGVKYYVTDGKVTCSGLAKGNIVDKGDGLHYTRMLTATEQSRRGYKPESVVVEGTYARLGEYHQGVVCVDGTVKPFILEE